MKLALPSVLELQESYTGDQATDLGMLNTVLKNLRTYMQYLVLALINSQIVAYPIAWTPGVINDGKAATVSVTVRRVNIGMPVAVGFDIALPAGMLLVGYVTAVDTVQVTLANHNGAQQTIGAGNIWITVLVN